MIETKFTVEPPGPCRLCKTPTYYKCGNVCVCPVCAIDHDYADIETEKPKTMEGAKRNVMGDPIILEYVYSCGHKVLKRNIPVSSNGHLSTAKCPVCNAGKIAGKHYQCNMCHEKFYKKGATGNPLYCTECARIRKHESYVRATKRTKAMGPGNQPKIDVERFKYPQLDILDFICQGNSEQEFMYHGF